MKRHERLEACVFSWSLWVVLTAVWTSLAGSGPLPWLLPTTTAGSPPAG
jgi:hypothetical protein